MELEERRLRSVGDGRVLHTLPNGIHILRRKKHEPIDLAGWSQEKVVNRTGKVMGSKFLPGTTLQRIVALAAEIIQENGVQPGTPDGRYAKIYGEPVGISQGRKVRAVRVVTSCHSTEAHAYPEDEQRL
jgi:hypothetical protein